MADLDLGPFALQTPLARGGMAEVWRGVHRASGARVAVKLLPRGTDDRESRVAFEREVRAVAVMDHPGIVHVVDHGRLDEETERRSRGRLRAGAPYLVMEHASGGTLARVGALDQWSTARSVLLSLLDALAHAHARGVIHRDLKPGNVLLCTGTDDRPGLKLTDFGIAHAVGHQGDESVRAGTLHFMAPEQIRGDLRSVGPWTDLYALACTAWVLFTGRTLFSGLSGLALQAAHLDESPPALDAAFDVPAGVRQWLSCLLSKRPEDRFKRAAEAAAALLSLTGVPTRVAPSMDQTPEAVARAVDGVPRVPGLVVQAPTTLAVGAAHGFDGPRAVWRPTALSPEVGPRLEAPDTWRHPVPRPPSARLRGAGLGLLGLRELRLMGRDQELDRGWEAVRRVAAADGRSEVLLIQGAAGVGRSRVAHTLAERAHELAVAEVFVAEHGQGEPPWAGMAAMIRRTLGLGGLARPDLLALCEDALGPGRDASVLCEMVAPATSADRQAGMAISEPVGAAELAGVLARTLTRLAGERMALVVLDDAHSDEQALDWAHGVLTRPDLAQARLLVVVTVREDALAQPEVDEAVRRLRAHPRTEAVELGALEPGALLEMLRDLLGLEASTASRVIERAEGNPQLAVSVVRQWAERGLLVMGEHGFAVARGAHVELPDSLADAWNRRAREALAELPADAWSWAQRAAVFGPWVDRKLWSAACMGADLMVLQALEEELVARRLAVTRDDGWRLSHATLREALLASASADGSLPLHHRACAAALALTGRRALDGMIGLHLLRSGAVEAAIEPLLRAATQPGNQWRGLNEVALAEEAMEGAGLEFTDPRWGRVWVRRAALCMRAGRYSEAETWARRALWRAEAQGWPAVAASAAFELAVVALHVHSEDADRLVRQAFELAQRVGAEEARPRALYIRAAAASHRREHDDARRFYAEALEAFTAVGDSAGAADVLRDLGNLDLLEGALQEAAEHYGSARDLYLQTQAILGLAHVHNGLGDVARRQGRLGDAEVAYGTALELFDRVGAGQASLARLNLALVLVASEKWPAARELLEGTRMWLVEQDRTVWAGAASGVLLPVYAALGDWEAWDRAVGEVERMVAASGFAQPDLLWAAERAAALCRAAGKLSRTARVELIVADQAGRLGRR